MKSSKKYFIFSLFSFVLFVLWTILIQCVDVKPIGVNDTNVGFATLNGFVHALTGVNMNLYLITDWLGLVPVFVCLLFCVIGFIQLLKRRNLSKVDFDILILGLYYVIVIVCYLLFEMIPINYRPILINGFMEASYPSSTTLLVLSVMPTLNFQTKYRCKNKVIINFVLIFIIVFSVFMVVGRLISGVHWITDIVGSLFLSAGLFYSYKFVVPIKND